MPDLIGINDRFVKTPAGAMSRERSFGRGDWRVDSRPALRALEGRLGEAKTGWTRSASSRSLWAGSRRVDAGIAAGLADGADLAAGEGDRKGVGRYKWRSDRA